MSFLGACSFLSNRGFNAMMEFHQSLEKGTPLREIAERLGVSVSRVAQLKDEYFVRPYFFKPEVEDAIELYLQTEKERGEEKQNFYRTVKDRQKLKALWMRVKA